MQTVRAPLTLRSATRHDRRHIYNPDGLRHWFASLGRSQTGLGGTDVVVAGDSIASGWGLTNVAQFSWPSILRRKLQAHFNPSGVSGGMGWIPLSSSPAGQALHPGIAITINAANWTMYAGTDTLGRRAYRHSLNAGVTGATIELTCDDAASMDATVAGSTLPYLTDLEASINNIGLGEASMSTIKLSMDQAAGTYTDIKTGLVLPATARSGYRVGRKATADAECWSHAKPTTGTYKYKLTAEEDQYCDVNGFVHYCDDWYCGVRLHNFGHGGDMARTYVDSGTALATSTGAGNNTGLTPLWSFDDDATYTFYAGADKPANKRIGLFVISVGLNEYRNNPVETYNTPNVHLEGLRAIVARILALRPVAKPASILFVPQFQPGGTNDAAVTYKWQQYVGNFYTVADENPDYVSVCDLWELSDRAVQSGSDTNNDWLNNAGILQGDKLHATPHGQGWIANAVFGALAG